MKILCLGDIAINDVSLIGCRWSLPGNIVPGNDEKIIFNWEVPLGEKVITKPRDSGPRLFVDIRTPHILEKWAPGYATLATNHMLDAGTKGLSDTIHELQVIGFKTIGAGLTEDDISEPIVWKTDQGCLSIVNWVFPETNPDWMSVPGVNCWQGLDKAEKMISRLKEKSDWVMTILHWSDELFYYPRPEDRDIAQRLVQMGSDMIIGHHPHVVRGYEFIKGCPIFYSLGNFFFSDFRINNGGWIRQAPLNKLGLGVVFSFQKGSLPSFEIISYLQTKQGVIVDKLRRAEKRLDKLNLPLERFANKEYSIWYHKERSKFMKLTAKWEFGIRKLGIKGVSKYFLNKIKILR